MATFQELENTVEKLKETVDKQQKVIDFFVLSDRYLFQKDIELLDGRKIKMGIGTGTQIGTTSSEKISLWGVTPVDQPETVTDASASSVTDTGDSTDNSTINSNFSSVVTAINTIKDRLQEVGIMK